MNLQSLSLFSSLLRLCPSDRHVPPSEELHPEPRGWFLLGLCGGTRDRTCVSASPWRCVPASLTQQKKETIEGLGWFITVFGALVHFTQYLMSELSLPPAFVPCSLTPTRSQSVSTGSSSFPSLLSWRLSLFSPPSCVGWGWSTMARGTAAETRCTWAASWLLWCKLLSTAFTGPNVACRSWDDTFSEIHTRATSRREAFDLWAVKGQCWHQYDFASSWCADIASFQCL